MNDNERQRDKEKKAVKVREKKKEKPAVMNGLNKLKREILYKEKRETR